jgi:hypothetical protein
MVRCSCPIRRRAACGESRTAENERAAARCAGGSLARGRAMRRGRDRARGQLLYNRTAWPVTRRRRGGPNMQPAIAGGTWVKANARALADVRRCRGCFASGVPQGQRCRQRDARRFASCRNDGTLAASSPTSPPRSFGDWRLLGGAEDDVAGQASCGGACRRPVFVICTLTIFQVPFVAHRCRCRVVRLRRLAVSACRSCAVRPLSSAVSPYKAAR